MDVLSIIDLGSSGEADGASLTRIVAEVGAACRDVGFFYVVNHGVDQELIAKAFAQSRDFFALPLADKRKLAIETIGGNRGYSGLLHEARDPARGPDMKEASNVGLELAADDPELLAGKPFRSLNAWPGVPGFRETLLSYYDACAGLGARLHRAFAGDLGLRTDCRSHRRATRVVRPQSLERPLLATLAVQFKLLYVRYPQMTMR
jgi:isopenicillin N synthase-like dioxygenase